MSHDHDDDTLPFPPDEDRPLDQVLLASNRLNRTISNALSDAADNLLAKAIQRILDGDEERARAFVARALKLPRDDDEDVDPAPWSAHMALFGSIDDDFEDSEPGDQGWIDRAEALIGTCGPAADGEIRLALSTYLDASHELSKGELRRVKALTVGVTYDDDPLAGVPDDDQARLDALVEVLRVTIEHQRLMAARYPDDEDDE